MKEQIVVVGGYGHVGQTVCRELAALFPGQVYAAGRSLERAEQFSRETGGVVKPMRLDIHGTPEPSALADIRLLVMCVDQTDTVFVRACLSQGIDYLDITADDRFLSRAEGLHRDAEQGGATAVLSIGLAPGLTNLLAAYASRLLDRTDTIDISIMLGLGDQHGKAALEWTVDNLSTTYAVVEHGSNRRVSSFTDGRRTDFGASLGRRTAYRFNFADQHALARTLGAPSVATRLCFDSAAITGLVAGMRASGVSRLLRLRPVRDAAVRLLGHVKLGSAGFALKIDTAGEKDGRRLTVECFLQGEREAELTGRVAVVIAEAIYRSRQRHGIYHVEQLFQWNPVVSALGQAVTWSYRVNDGPE
ncbi:saccharopine dehydrogenase NADP-binding domain-containing protein [Paenibacillus filicis]|uniref:Saccharopine dehydrogenase NADP-binding domain-containing protein n=1 Tax=Paenibacillus filicis TaxID=669464 RepID=A0ABU9DH78_9BACL